MRKSFGVVLSSAVLLSISGCSDGNKCGPGTKLVGNMCVPISDTDGGGNNQDGGGKNQDGGGKNQDGGQTTDGSLLDSFLVDGKTSDGLVKQPKCGNGIKEKGEDCDDGNLNNNDACLKTCKKNVCGDGIINTGVEECDDANKDETDLCISTCKLARCGDGYVYKGIEDCDDGNNKDGDGCPAFCKLFSKQKGKVVGQVQRFGLSKNAGITVKLDNSNYSTKTLSDGTFEMKEVPAGIYSLTASYPAYQDEHFKNITVIPTASFAVPAITLLRPERIDASASWGGLSKGDQYVFWLDISGILRKRSTAGGTVQTVATSVRTVKFINKKQHILYQLTNADLFIVAATGGQPKKVVSKASYFAEIQEDGWLLVITSDKEAYAVSPDGKTVQLITSDYRYMTTLDKAKRVLVVGGDGIRVMPWSGGPPVALDVNKNAKYCGSSVNSTGNCSSSSGVGFTQDQKRVYYYVHSGTKGEFRSADTSTGKPIKLLSLDWPTGVTSAQASRFGTNEYLMVKEYGRVSGADWARFRTVPIAGGAVSTVGEFHKVSGKKWYGSMVYSPNGNHVALTTYDMPSSLYELVVVPTDGSPKTKVLDMGYQRYLSFSTDGKRVIWVFSTVGYGYEGPLKSANVSGTDIRTHEANIRSYNGTIIGLASELLYWKYASGSYELRRAAYASSTSSVQANCRNPSPLTKLGDDTTYYSCSDKSNGENHLHLYNSKYGDKDLGFNTSLTVVSDKSVMMLRSYEPSTSTYTYTLLNLATGSTATVAKNINEYVSLSSYETAPGKYTFFSNMGRDGLPVICAHSNPMSGSVVGTMKGFFSRMLTTQSGTRYYIYQDGALTGSPLRAVNLETCKVHQVAVGGTSYRGVWFTPDEKSMLFASDGGLGVTPLAGGTPKQLVAQGTMVQMIDKWLFYRGYAYSPKGTISAVISIPLAGGASVPIDYAFNNSRQWSGDKDLLYYSGALRYLDMP